MNLGSPGPADKADKSLPYNNDHGWGHGRGLNQADISGEKPAGTLVLINLKARINSLRNRTALIIKENMAIEEKGIKIS